MTYRAASPTLRTSTPASDLVWWLAVGTVRIPTRMGAGDFETSTWLLHEKTWFEARERARVLFGTDRVKVWRQ